MPEQVRPPKAGSFRRKGEGRAAPIRALRGPHPLHFTLCLWYAKKALEGERYLEELARIFAAEGIDQWGICSFQGLPLLPVGSRRRLPEDARSVIVILIGYYIGEYPNRNLSRYALVDDYHTVFGEKLGRVVENLWNLFKTHRFIQFVDASPIQEVLAAYRAGLGDVGQNGQLLNPVYGSRCFIGEIVTDLELPPFSGEPPKICTNCGACVSACPTSALSPQGFQKDRCRSWITQKKGKLTPWEARQIQLGGFVWGCDRCTDACPVNRGAAASRVPEFYQGVVPRLTPENAGPLCASKAYGWRGETLLLRNLRLLADRPLL